MNAFLPPRPTGDDAESRFMQWVWDQIAAGRICDSSDIAVSRTARGVQLNIKALAGIQSSAAAPIQMFAIRANNGTDHLVCRSWDGANFGTTDVLVAKPTRMRSALVTSETFDGGTISYTRPNTSDGYTLDNNRTATLGATSEAQVVFPRYVSMQKLGLDTYLTTPPTALQARAFSASLAVIFACQPSNGTGLTIINQPNPDVPVTWLEISPSRVWARRYTQ